MKITDHLFFHSKPFLWRKAFLILGVLVLFFSACQQKPTKVTEVDLDQEDRVFSKVQVNGKVELKKSVIIDVRSRFDHQMSKPPRSFYAYWKDWDLRGLSGKRLGDKADELQRLLALKGVEPYSHVVVFGRGLKGNGEEFLLASTLIALGIDRISFMTDDQFKDALTAKNVPELENAPYWDEPVRYQWTCPTESEPDLFVEKNKGPQSGPSVDVTHVFDKKLNINKKNTKWLRAEKLKSSSGFWAYGLALHRRKMGKPACVVENNKG